jgi:hypothetical protein
MHASMQARRDGGEGLHLSRLVRKVWVRCRGLRGCWLVVFWGGLTGQAVAWVRIDGRTLLHYC